MGRHKRRRVAGFQEVLPTGRNEQADVVWCSLNLRRERIAAIHDGDQVLEVVAGDRIPASAIVKRGQFRGHKIGRRDQPNYRTAGQPKRLGRTKRIGVPPCRKSKNLPLRRHDIDDLSRSIEKSPAAPRGTFSCVFLKPKSR
jgi:hypothetical protein